MTSYRKPAPYRKPQTYRGTEIVPSASIPTKHTNIAAAWEKPEVGAESFASAWRDSRPNNETIDALYGDVESQFSRMTSVPMHALAAHSDPASLHWDAIAANDEVTALPIRQLHAHDQQTRLAWGDFQGRHADATAAPWRSPKPHSHLSALPWGQLAAHSLSRSVLWHSIIARGGYVALPWGPIAARSNSIRIDWPVEPDPQPGVITIPTLPVYVMLPTLSAVRLPDRTPIPMLGISLQGDLGSWAWSFTAPVSRAATAMLNAPGGAPTEIEVTINGYVWTFLVDGFDDNRRFGSNTATLRGRSRSALLAEPYAATRTYTETAARNASQLADDELPLGWTLLWDAPDWLVPGGTFSYQDLAPINAIAQLANAIGATVLSDAATLSLTVAPSYPASPWAWDTSTPYAILPASILTQGDSSWQGGINADGVYVYAENAASGALVKLTGSAGATQLPMIVERLAVSADPQRERGRIALAGAGIKRTVNRTIPMFPTPAPAGQPSFGPVPLGKLLEVEDVDETWRGQVVSVRIDAQRGGSALSVRQHLTIERQYR